MRISDWSSDVCSSDLRLRLQAATGRYLAIPSARRPIARRYQERRSARLRGPVVPSCVPYYRMGRHVDPELVHHSNDRSDRNQSDLRQFSMIRSEEHTSELQSLMRTSYAVFCLKKKKQHTNPH